MSDVDDRSLNLEPDQESVEHGHAADSIADMAERFEDNDAGTPAESLRGLVSYLVQNLVDDPTAVECTVDQHGSAVQVTVLVPEEDLGKVIGRGGRIAKAMRTALMIAGSRHHLRVSLDIEGKTPESPA